MRRAASQVLKSARRTQYGRRYYINTRTFSTSPVNLVRQSRITPIKYPEGQLHPPLQSAVPFRTFAIFLVSSLVASGAWYAARSNTGEQGLRRDNSTTSTGNLLSTLSTSPLSYVTTPLLTESSAPFPSSNPEDESRRALVVEDGHFFTGSLVGDGPVSKEVDDSGRLVLEMLTPEQATQKLRQNQQSYLVGRGRGVIRYDTVQLASNSPIEDDHVEKIVPVPDAISTPELPASKPDWMFWGVFDGHRYRNPRCGLININARQRLDHISQIATDTCLVRSSRT